MKWWEGKFKLVGKPLLPIFVGRDGKEVVMKPRRKKRGTANVRPRRDSGA